MSEDGGLPKKKPKNMKEASLKNLRGEPGHRLNRELNKNRIIDDVDVFSVWLRMSEPGDRCIYHYGNLMKDRQLTPRGDIVRPGGPLDTLAHAVMRANEDGAVALFQRRIDNHICEYAAVRR